MKTIANHYLLILRSSLLAVLLLAASDNARASESDPWTYAYIPLADSATLVSEQLRNALQTTVAAVNAKHAANISDLDDTALEFEFFTEFRSLHIRDVTWGLFEQCIGTNNCPGWPEFERIQMHPGESVYRAANWRYIPSRFHLASIIQVCEVRMGADKLTHFFDDGFHYFNALRSKRRDFDAEDIRQLSMAFEKSYMGTRITGIVSRADIEANLAGVRFYSDFFGGASPLLARDFDGRLTLLRNPDICDYVTVQYDERVLENEFVFGLLDTTRARDRSNALQRVIEARRIRATWLAVELDGAELLDHKRSLLARRIPMTVWQSDFPKARMIGHATGFMTHWIFDSGLRHASSLFGFNPLKPGKFADRKPVTIKRVELTLSGK